MRERALEIQEALENYDIYNPTVNETVKKKTEKPLLIVKISNAFEANFLASICKRTSDAPKDIELCVKYQEAIKPLGFIELTFDNIQTIHEYNPQLKIGIYNNEKFNLLTYEQELCLS